MSQLHLEEDVMQNRFTTICMVSLTFAAGACRTASPRYPAASDPGVITSTQLQEFKSASALDAIRKVRPNFLLSRGQTSLSGTSSPFPTVYLDGVRYGDISMLRQIPAAWIAEIRLYRTSTFAHLGADEIGGVIAITTRQR
jgi:outer membrane cobalamin receptor